MEEVEECKSKENKTERTKTSLTSSEGSKRSSIDITIKTIRKETENGIVMYSAQQLSEIRESSASTDWPDFLDEGFKNARGQWDPDRWHQNRKRGSTPPPAEGDKLPDRRERDTAYAGHLNSERNAAKVPGVQERTPGLLEGNKKKSLDPKERIKAECEEIVLSPQRRSFTTGCQVAQLAAKDDGQEKGNNDKGSRPVERDSDIVARDRIRESRGNDHRSERNLYDRASDKDDVPLSLREGRRRDGINEIEERNRRVGSGRIVTSRLDRDRGVGSDDYGNNDRIRNDRIRDQNPIDRNNFPDNRDRNQVERKSITSFDRRELGREDARDLQGNGRNRFGFQRERELDDPKDRLRRDEPNDSEFDRNRGRDIRGGEWNDPKLKEYELKRERYPNNQYGYQCNDRPNARNDRREDRHFEGDRGDQRFKNAYHTPDEPPKQVTEGYYNQRYQQYGYGRKDRGGSRYSRRSETEEPEWMSESVTMGGELMELHGFDDSPEKDIVPNPSSTRKEGNSGNKFYGQIHLQKEGAKPDTRSGKASAKDTKNDDASYISLDDILHLDSIPGLANILADDSLDPTSAGEQSFLGQISSNEGATKQKVNLREGGSKFSQFFQQDTKQMLNKAADLSSDFDLDKMSLRQDHVGIKEILKSSDEVLFSNGNELNSAGFKNILPMSDNTAVPSIRIPSPGNPSAYFAPISPAAKTSNIEQLTDVNSPNNNLMEMLRLQRDATDCNDIEGNFKNGTAPPTLQQLRSNKNVKSVEELEADIKHMVGISCNDKELDECHNEENMYSGVTGDDGDQYLEKSFDNSNKDIRDQNQGDLSAFKKFAALMEGTVTAADDHTPQMNYKDGNEAENKIFFDGMRSGVVKPSPIPLNAPTEEDIMYQEGRHHSRRMPHGDIPLPSDEYQQHISQQVRMNQNGSELHRMNQSIPQPLPRLPQPMPMAPQNIPVSMPLPDQGNLAMLQLISQAPFKHDLLKCPEAITLQTALNIGEVSPLILLNQFIHGNLPPLQREILLNVLKVAQNKGHLGPLPPAPVSPTHPGSRQFNVPGNASQTYSQHLNIHASKQGASISPPGPNSAPPEALQLLMQQQNQLSQQQQRVSPMLLGAGGQAGSKNTLSVSPIPGQQRIPSPQELVFHTQQIMQNALIKRKLEEQKENYRRRQDFHGVGSFRERSDSDSKGSGNGNACGESPLAFTPMSVMKKMAADRRDSDPKVINSIPELKLSQANSDMPDTTFGPSGDVCPSAQNPRSKLEAEENLTNPDRVNQHFEDSQRLKSMFPDAHENTQLGLSESSSILNSVPVTLPVTHATASNHPFNPNHIHLQQAALQRAQQLQNQWALGSPPTIGNSRPPPYPGLAPFEQQLLMQQQGYGAPLPPNIAAAVGVRFPPNQQLPQMPNFPGGIPQHLPPEMSNAPFRHQQSISGSAAMNAHADSQSFGTPSQGNLSKFFSPEVLAQAQSGNAPSMPPLPTQKALTLEEIELQAAAVRI